MQDRDLLYEQVEVRVFEPDGELLTEELAKMLLGWTEPAEGESFDDYLLKDLEGTTIVCSNNDLQRPYYAQSATDLMWDILGGNWEFNLETVIIGETGLVLDGKHRLIALVLACQEYNRNPDRYPHWESQPEIPIIVGLGAKETKRLVNTIGTGKPRSLSDSFYASGLFDTKDKSQLKRLCRMAEHTIKMLWTRMDAKSEAYNVKFSHTDALEFIERHPRILEAISTIYHEDSPNKPHTVSSFAGAYAPALLYLMMISDTEPLKYKESDPPNERDLDFSSEEVAERYWVELIENSDTVSSVTEAIRELSESGNFKADERIAIIIKGFHAYKTSQSVRPEDIKLDVTIDDNGFRSLQDHPLVGGVDVGPK